MRSDLRAPRCSSTVTGTARTRPSVPTSCREALLPLRFRYITIEICHRGKRLALGVVRFVEIDDWRFAVFHEIVAEGL
jgi:hypothetical protein